MVGHVTPGAETQSLGCMGNSTDDTPYKWTFPLLVEPRMIVV